MGLLTVGVLAFQALIFATMYVGAKVGRRSLNFCAGAWTIFTLLGSIATAGLMLLQMITIIGSYIYFFENATSSIASEPRKSLSQTAGEVWDFIRIALVAVLVVGWVISEWIK